MATDIVRTTTGSNFQGETWMTILENPCAAYGRHNILNAICGYWEPLCSRF